MSLEVLSVGDEVITLAQARSHLNLTATGSPPTHFDDDYIEDFLIPTAREAVEQYIGRAVVLQTVKYTMTGWQDIYLPFCTLAEIESVKYDDTNGDEQTLAASGYWFTADGKLIMRELPGLDDAPDNVRITYTTGYDLEASPPDLLPNSLKQAMFLLIGHLYENRESTNPMEVKELPLGFYSLLTPYRTFGI